jgi:multidrug efflux pump subunit AcrB
MRASRWALNHRWITIGAAAAFFVGSILLIPLLPTGFIPPDDNSQTQVYIELPPGSTLKQTRDAAEHARQLLDKVDHIQSIYTTIGGGAAGSDPFAPPGTTEVRSPCC